TQTLTSPKLSTGLSKALSTICLWHKPLTTDIAHTIMKEPMPSLPLFQGKSIPFLPFLDSNTRILIIRNI
ncbi:MAG: hypothetical protein K2G80_09300, partial [Bacteroidales bacterium]|nr:hypothetical protein [Bacteroidales bacterium]